MTIRVLVVDDEMPARRRLERLLARHADVQVVGSTGNPHEAVAALRAGGIDLVLLDMQMPELTGLDVVREVTPALLPPCIFVTAYEQYALRAFEVSAVDYLLKPFSDERFDEALHRVRLRVGAAEAGTLVEQLRALIAVAGTGGDPAARGTKPAPLERIAVDVRGERLLISTADIDFISADGPYAELHVAGRRHLLRERMHVLEASLDERIFIRIHRSTIVNVERIAALEPLFRGDYAVRLRNGVRLKLSRTHRAAVAKRLGLRI